MGGGAAPFVPVPAVPSSPQKITKQPEWAWAKYKYLHIRSFFIMHNLLVIILKLECALYRVGTVIQIQGMLITLLFCCFQLNASMTDKEFIVDK